MTYIKGNRPVQLPGDVVPTTVEQFTCQPKDSVTVDAHPYLNNFLDGVKEGFKIPFAMLFGMAGCSTHGSPLIDTKTIVYTDCNGADGGNFADGSGDALTLEDSAQDVGADLADDVTVAVDGEELPPDAMSVDDADAVVLPDVVTEDVMPDVEDVAVDVAEDAMLTDVAEDVNLPQDATAEVADDADAGICQYFCDAGIAEKDVGLPAEVTMAADATAADAGAPSGVVSQMCSGPAGTQTLSAPLNSVAVACTNDTINSLILGAKGCVAECGFYDNNVVLSTNPNTPVKFALDLFTPPQAPMQAYTITLSLQSPVLSDGSTPALPGFMGSSFVFAFNQKMYDTIGDVVWDAQDTDPKGNLQGTVQIKYQPQDFFFNLPEFLDITYTDTIGNKISYRYPCDQLPNPIVSCTEVK